MLLGWLFFSAIAAHAQIFSSDSSRIRFAPNKVPDGVTWSPSVSLTDGGLSSEKLPPDRSAEVWVQSQPIPAGMSWRPPPTLMLYKLLIVATYNVQTDRAHT